MTKQPTQSPEQLARLAELAEESGIPTKFDLLAADVVAGETATQQRERLGNRRSRLDYLDNALKIDGDISTSISHYVEVLTKLIAKCGDVGLDQRELIEERRNAAQSLIEVERARRVLAELRAEIVS